MAVVNIEQGTHLKAVANLLELSRFLHSTLPHSLLMNKVAGIPNRRRNSYAMDKSESPIKKILPLSESSTSPTTKTSQQTRAAKYNLEMLHRLQVARVPIHYTRYTY